MIRIPLAILLSDIKSSRKIGSFTQNIFVAACVFVLVSTLVRFVHPKRSIRVHHLCLTALFVVAQLTSQIHFQFGIEMSSSSSSELQTIMDEIAQLKAENAALKQQLSAHVAIPPLASPPPPKSASGGNLRALAHAHHNTSLSSALSPSVMAAQREEKELIVQSLNHKSFTVIVLGASGDVRARFNDILNILPYHLLDLTRFAWACCVWTSSPRRRPTLPCLRSFARA
jgi:hypothetical protein